MIYVYAITEGAPPPQALVGLPGFDDTPVAAREVDGIAAAFGRVAAAPRPSTEAVWQHERVVERLMADRPLLPARFGTLMRDVAAVDGVLAANHERLATGLERVRGCVELGVRALWRADEWDDDSASTPPPEEGAVPADDDGAGRAYLMALADRERRRRRTEVRAAELAANLNRMFLPLARDGVVRQLPTAQFVIAGAYLVPTERVEGFRAAVNDAGAALGRLRLVCSGPWPPYHFVPALSLPPAPTAEVSRG